MIVLLCRSIYQAIECDTGEKKVSFVTCISTQMYFKSISKISLKAMNIRRVRLIHTRQLARQECRTSGMCFKCVCALGRRVSYNRAREYMLSHIYLRIFEDNLHSQFEL